MTAQLNLEEINVAIYNSTNHNPEIRKRINDIAIKNNWHIFFIEMFHNDLQWNLSNVDNIKYLLNCATDKNKIQQIMSSIRNEQSSMFKKYQSINKSEGISFMSFFGTSQCQRYECHINKDMSFTMKIVLQYLRHVSTKKTKIFLLQCENIIDSSRKQIITKVSQFFAGKTLRVYSDTDVLSITILKKIIKKTKIPTITKMIIATPTQASFFMNQINWLCLYNYLFLV